MSEAQKLVDYLNARIARTGYNERQCMANTVSFSLMQGKKYARIVQSNAQSEGMGKSRSAYAFVDAAGNIYKVAGWKAPAPGVRATVDDVTQERHWFFKPSLGAAAAGFDSAAYSTGWLYR
jgi:hypothetical protein